MVDDFGGTNSDQGTYGPVGPTSGSEPAPNPNQGPAGPPGPAGPSIDRYAATRIVSPDPDQGTDTTIQAAINNLPSGGGTIFVKAGDYSEFLVFAAKNTVLNFAPGANLRPQGDGEIFQFPDGPTEIVDVEIINPRVFGQAAQLQTLCAYKDTGARWRVITRNAQVQDVHIIDDAQAGDLTFSRPVRVEHYDPVFTPSDVGTHILAQTPSVAGTYLFACSIHYHGTSILGINEEQQGGAWTLDFDGDLIFHDLAYLDLAGTPVVDGMASTGLFSLFAPFGPYTVQTIGGSWDSFETFLHLGLLGPVTFSLSGQTNVNDLRIYNADAHVLLRESRITINVHQGPQVTGVVVDVLEGADACTITGSFTDSTVASIRIAAQKTAVDGAAFRQGVGKTILEVAPANYTMVSGCTRIGASGAPTGFTKVGAQSLIAVGTVNVE